MSKLQPREWLVEDPKSGKSHKVSVHTTHISYRVAREIGNKEIKHYPKSKLLHIHAANENIYYFKPNEQKLKATSPTSP